MIDYPHWKVLEESEGSKTKWQVMTYPKFVPLIPKGFDAGRAMAAGLDMRDALIAAVSPQGWEAINPVMPVKQVRVSLEDSSVIIEPGAMMLTKGNIEMTLESGAGVGSVLKNAATSAASGESFIKSRFTGTGDVLLQPREDYIHMINLQNQTLVCDQRLFVACDGSCQVGTMINKLSAAFYGNEGFVMPRVQGTGMVMLQTPVSSSKIMVVELDNETLQVDGPFVMAYWGDIEFTSKRAGNGLIRSIASGEGRVNSYKGTGTVWINLQEAGCFPVKAPAK